MPTNPNNSPNAPYASDWQEVTPGAPVAASAPTPAPSSDPSSQSHWYDPITKAWNWANTPISYSRPGPLKYLIPKSPAEAAQEAEEKANELHPDDSRTENFLRSAGYGIASDLNRMVSPLTVAGALTGPLAAAGEAGEVPAIISKAARAAQAVMSAPFIGTGAHHVYQGVKEIVPESMGGGGQKFWMPDVLEKLAGGAAEMAGGAAGVLSAARPPKLHFTEDQINSLDHDAARGVQKHLSDFATKERAAAGADIAADDAQLDEAFPTGVVDGQQIFQQVNPMRKELFPAGGRPEPKILSRVEAAAQAKANSPIPQNVLNDFLERGVITQDELNRTWSAKEARTIEGNLQVEAKRYARGQNPDLRSAKIVRDLANQIHEARQAAADSINIGDEFQQHNARYAQYKDTFENGPLAKSLKGKNANAVLNPFVGPNGENIRRQLMPYADQGVNVKGLRDVAEFHGKVKDAFANTGSMKNRLLTGAGMMAIGMGIGHPFLGLIGASMAGRQAISTALAKGAVASEAEHLPIEPLTEKYSLPMPERGMFAGKIARGAVTAGTPAAHETASDSSPNVPPSMIVQAAQSAEAAPGPYGKPTHIDRDNGQRIMRHPVTGKWVDVDTGKLLRNLEKVGQ